MKLIKSKKYILKYDYFVTEDGKVFSDYTKKFLTISLDKDGYEKVRLVTTTGRHTFSIHRLVMETFFPCEIMEKLQVNHKDGNKRNNCLANLEWCTCQENIIHAISTGLRKNTLEENNNAPHKLTREQVQEIITLLLSKKFTHQQIADKYNVNVTSIERIKYKKHGKVLLKKLISLRRSTTKFVVCKLMANETGSSVFYG